MNPRHRRLVIPLALVALLLVVVVAVGDEVSEPLLRALARMRGHLLDPDALVKAVASGRQKGQQPAGGGSSSATSTSRPAATCR